jgi:Carbohydrate binding domain (family 11)
MVCARCGSLGDICCAGNACTSGCCSGGRCIATCTTGTGGTVGTGGVTGSGGRIGTGGAIGTGGCGSLIDNMEAGTGKICAGSGRSGIWFTYVDNTTTSLVSPAAGGTPLPALVSPVRGTSSYAMHITGYYSTYAGIGVWLNNTSSVSQPSTYNATGYTGITFWAKGNGSLKVVGQMPSTESTSYGGTCVAASCAGNSYAYGQLSSTTWTQVMVPFSYLTGGTATPFLPSAIWSLEFQYYSTVSLGGAAFDLWIDDLSFY